MVREFVVAEDRERDFEKIFGREGLWPDLLRRSPQYAGSELRMELQGSKSHESGGRRYKVFDFWRTHEDFESFRREHQVELEKFNRWLGGEGLIERETVLGSFYQDDSDGDEGTGLVSA